MNVGVVHDLPTGGALRVLSEWLARTTATSVTVYCRDASVHAFAPLPGHTTVVEVPTHRGGSPLDEARRLATSTRDGRALAARVDAAGHDVVFCCASRLTQAPDVLPALRTTSVYYAPEPLRSATEPGALMFPGDGWKQRLTRANANPLEWRRRQLDRRAIRAARHVVTHSRFTAGTLRETYGVHATVVPLGVDAAAFRPGQPERDGSVLAVGALHPLKGHDLVIDALATLPAETRPRLTIVGDRGEAEAEIRTRAATKGVAVDLRQGIPFAELVDLYGRASVVACGQIREPFGLTPLEAMASATPVVAVDEGGFRETIRHEETGLLVPRDPHALGAAIARLIDDPGVLPAKGLRSAREEWTWERSAAAFDAQLSAAAAR